MLSPLPQSLSPLWTPPKVAAGSTPFTPTDLPNLLHWFDAGSYSLSNGAAVATNWANGGSGGDATPGGSPYFYTNQINGKPAILGSGINKFSVTSATITSFTALAVFQKQATGSNVVLFGGRAYSGVECYTDGSLYYIDDTTTNVIGNAYTDTAAWQLIVGQTTATNWITSQNGVQVTSGSTTILSTAVTSLFAHEAGQQADLKIAELLIYSNALSSADMTRAENYLKTKYGFTY
jgi:hypothetical protein